LVGSFNEHKTEKHQHYFQNSYGNNQGIFNSIVIKNVDGISGVVDKSLYAKSSNGSSDWQAVASVEVGYPAGVRTGYENAPVWLSVLFLISY
jgi:hypothetical protein